MTGHWSHFVHQADIGVCGEGDTLAEAFAQAALALSAIVAEPATIEPRQRLELACEAPDVELLLVDWLNAVIYAMATQQRLFGRFDVTITDHRLQAYAYGEPVDVARHAPAVEPKGATYTGLRVAQTPDGRWLAQCVVDV